MAVYFAQPELLQLANSTPTKGAVWPPLNYETCTSVDTTQYPPIIIKVTNAAVSALTSMR